MKKLGNIIESGEYQSVSKRIRKFKASCDPETYKDLFLSAAQDKMYGGAFVVDEQNKDAINQLYYYLIGSPQFDGDLMKGIIMMGAIGNGKTILIESFIDVFNECADKIITCIHSKDVARVLTDQEVGYMNKRPMFFDDMGKEQEAIKVYGTVVHPMEDVFNERYKNQALTFATSNYKFEDMKYSRHMIDRIRQMMNVIVLPGNSRR